MKNIFDTSQSPNHIDFKESQMDAERWGNKKFEKWQKNDLNTIELRTLQDFSMVPDYVDGYLKATEGKFITDLTLIANHQSILGNHSPEELIKTIEILDKAIEKVTIKEPMYAYLREDESFFKMSVTSLFNFDEDEVDLKKFQELRANYLNKTVPIYHFLIPSLVKTPQGATQFQNRQFPIVVKIFMPQGTNAGYLGKVSFFSKNAQMIIGRKQNQENYALKFEKFSIEKDQFGKEIVNVSASIITQQ